MSVRNEQYILIIGGYWGESGSRYPLEKICVLNLDTITFYESKVKLPISARGSCHAVLSSNHALNVIVVLGLVNEFDAEYPMNLIELIAWWFAEENVHVLSNGSRTHCAISVDAILESLSELKLNKKQRGL